MSQMNPSASEYWVQVQEESLTLLLDRREHDGPEVVRVLLVGDVERHVQLSTVSMSTTYLIPSTNSSPRLTKKEKILWIDAHGHCHFGIPQFVWLYTFWCQYQYVAYRGATQTQTQPHRQKKGNDSDRSGDSSVQRQRPRS
jgi:hypothetical protein